MRQKASTSERVTTPSAFAILAESAIMAMAKGGLRGARSLSARPASTARRPETAAPTLPAPPAMMRGNAREDAHAIP